MAAQLLTVVAVGVDARVSSIGGSGAVRSMSALRLLRLVVGMELFLDLVDERRHGDEIVLDFEDVEI
jgi:hypothetical protein